MGWAWPQPQGFWLSTEPGFWGPHSPSLTSLPKAFLCSSYEEIGCVQWPNSCLRHASGLTFLRTDFPTLLPMLQLLFLIKITTKRVPSTELIIYGVLGRTCFEWPSILDHRTCGFYDCTQYPGKETEAQRVACPGITQQISVRAEKRAQALGQPSSFLWAHSQSGRCGQLYALIPQRPGENGIKLGREST